MTDPHDYDFDGDDDEGIVVHTPRDSGLGNDLLDGSEFDFLTSVPEDEGSRSAGEYFIAHPDSPIIEMGGDDDEFLLSAEAPIIDSEEARKELERIYQDIGQARRVLQNLYAMDEKKRGSIDLLLGEISSLESRRAGLIEDYEARETKYVARGIEMAEQAQEHQRRVAGALYLLAQRERDLESKALDLIDEESRLTRGHEINLREAKAIRDSRPFPIIPILAAAAIAGTIGFYLGRNPESTPEPITTLQEVVDAHHEYEPVAPELTPQPIVTRPHSKPLETRVTKTKRTQTLEQVVDAPQEQVTEEPKQIYTPSTFELPDVETIGIISSNYMKELEENPIEIDYTPQIHVTAIEDVITVPVPGPDGPIDEGEKIQKQIPTVLGLAQARDYQSREEQFLYFTSASLSTEDPYLAMAFSLKAGEYCKAGLGQLPFEQFGLNPRKINRLKSNLQEFEQSSAHQPFYSEFRVPGPSNCL